MLQLQWQQNATATATKRIEKSRQLAPLPLLLHENQSQATSQAACPRHGGTHARNPQSRPRDPKNPEPEPRPQ